MGVGTGRTKRPTEAVESSEEDRGPIPATHRERTPEETRKLRNGRGGPGSRTQPEPQKETIGTLKVLYSNVQSICNKIDELKCTVDKQDPDVIILTETWCNPNITQPFLEIPGNTLDPELRHDRSDTVNGIGGSILIYVRIGLTFLTCDLINDFNQHCRFSIKSKNDVLNFTVIYRSPNSNITNTNKLCDIINKVPTNSIIIGDINLSGIDWANHYADSKGLDFFNAINDNFMTQMINFPTHVKGNILDLLITDVPETVVNIEDIGRLGKSDHSMILFETTFNHDNSYSEEKIPNWSKANIDIINQDLTAIDWHNELKDLDTTEALKYFHNKVDETVIKNVPLKLRRLKTRPIWLTKCLKKKLRKKTESLGPVQKN